MREKFINQDTVQYQLQDKNAHLNEVKVLHEIPQAIQSSILYLTNTSSPQWKLIKHQDWWSLFYINPFSFACAFWNFLIILLIYIIQIQVSLVMAFNPTLLKQQIATNFFIPFVYTIITALFVDILLNFHKGYYAFGQGRVIDNPKNIVMKYAKGYFTIDVISVVFLFLLANVDNYWVNFLQIIPLFMFWIKKFKCQSEIEQYLQYNKIARIAFILIMLGIDVLILGHFGACIFAGIDLLLFNIQYYGAQTQYYWLSNNTSYSVDLLPGPWNIQYIYAQSFSSGTLSTLAPGPFGKNPIEDLYMIFLMTVFMILASYVAQVLINLLYVDEQKRVFHESNIQKFDQFMKLKEVTKDIKSRVHNFFELIWEVEVKMQTDAKNDVISRLPEKLKNKLIIEMSFFKIVRFFEYFPNYSDLEIQITNRITQQIMDSSSCIYLSGFEGIIAHQRSLYFIKDGIAKFYLDNKDKKGEHILALTNVEKLLGSYEFVTGMASPLSCKAIDLCVVDQLTFTDFRQVIVEHSLLQSFFELKELILFENRLDLLNKRCIVCLQWHMEDQCQQIFFNCAVKNYLISKGFNRNQKRTKYTRKQFISRRIKPGNGIYSENSKIQNPAQLFKMFNLQKIIIDLIQSQNIEVVQNFQSYRPLFNAQTFANH